MFQGCNQNLLSTAQKNEVLYQGFFLVNVTKSGFGHIYCGNLLPILGGADETSN